MCLMYSTPRCPVVSLRGCCVHSGGLPKASWPHGRGEWGWALGQAVLAVLILWFLLPGNSQVREEVWLLLSMSVVVAVVFLFRLLFELMKPDYDERQRRFGVLLVVVALMVLTAGLFHLRTEARALEIAEGIQTQSHEQTIRVSSCTVDRRNKILLELATVGGVFNVMAAGVLPINQDTDFEVSVGSGSPRLPCEHIQRHFMSNGFLSANDSAFGWVGDSAIALDLTPVQSVYLIVPGEIELKDCFFEYVHDGSRTYCSDKGVVFPKP